MKTLIERALGVVCLAAIVFYMPYKAQGTMTQYSGVITVTSVPSPLTGIVNGDKFNFNITIDDSDTDTSPSSTWGTFTSPMPGQVTRDSGNLGTWDPSGTVFQTILTSPSGLTIATSGGGSFVTGGGTTFPFLGLALDFNALPVTDTGFGQTLAQQLGGPLDPSLASPLPLLSRIGFGPGIGGTAPGLTRTVNATFTMQPVPEPSTYFAGAFALGIVGWTVYRQRRKQAA